MKLKFIKFIADLRFTIFILLIICFSSIIGTIIEQDQLIEFYKLNYPIINDKFKFLSWETILNVGFNHVYSSWWFISLILIFSLSLLTCTFFQQFPTLKTARRCQFFRTLEPFNKLKIYTIITQQSFSKSLSNLKLYNYTIFQQKNLLYTYKGIAGKIAPIVVHFSMILILFGTVIGSLDGFKAQENLSKTENFHIQNIFNKGQFTKIPNFSGRINDFWITYTPQKTVSQFYSDISILDNSGNEIKRETSFVNYPVIYKNVYFYQTEWNIIGLRIQFKNKPIVEYPLVNSLTPKTKVWISWISSTNDLTNGVLVFIDNLQGYCSLYDTKGQFLGNLELNENFKTNSEIKLIEILSATGLQIKTDPGILLIYTGFFFLMLSSLISYLTYSQVWVCIKSQKIFIGGNTTRATFEFENEFNNCFK